MKQLQSINPFSNEPIFSVDQDSDVAISEKLSRLQNGYVKWKDSSLEERSLVLKEIATNLLNNKEEYASLITSEMGKPITQSIAEIEKCAWVCNYYAEHGPAFLKEKIIETDASKSYIRFEPLGIILCVMPWNYPFWQFFRVLAPNLMLGNVLLLKHASNVSKSAIAIEQLLKKTYSTFSLMELLLIEASRVNAVIDNTKVKGVTLTGSEYAGAAVAERAGKNIKKSVLELGGSNACIILEDADLEKHIGEIVNARFQNTGQSCIAGKRYLVHEKIYQQFKALLLKEVRKLPLTDPSKTSCKIGTMASSKLAEELYEQLQTSIEQGAQLLWGGRQQEAHFEPTIVLVNDTKDPVFSEETFGPLAVIKTFKTLEEAIQLSNQSNFGLGVSIFTESIEKVKTLVSSFEEGAVFINSLVKSDPRLPFGGIKKSGYGRELGLEGIREFANIKTVYIR